MADNVPITAGTGTNVATDDVLGVHFQRVKLVDGTLDSSLPIAGDTTNGLDVDVTRVSGNVTVVQPTAANLQATVTAGSNFPAVATDGSAVVATGRMVMGTDGTNAQTIRVTPNGDQYVWVGGDDGTGTGTWQSASFDPTVTDGETNAVPHLNVHSRNAVFNGTTWDRVRGDIANGMDVDVTRVSGNVTVVQPTAANLNATVTGSGNFTVTQATASNLNANVSGTVTSNAGTGFGVVSLPSTSITQGPLVMGSDGTNARAIQTTTGGILKVDGSGATQPVSGSVTVSQGTATNLNATVVQPTAGNLNATVTAGSGFGVVTLPSTSITQGPLVMGSDGTNARAIQTTTGGILKVDGSAATQPVSGTVTVSQPTAANLNATVTGTVTAAQATAANLNATVVQATAANLNATVTAGSGFGIATAAGTASTTGPQLMGSDGTLARAVQTTTGGILKVDGSATTQPVSGTVTVSQATAANLNATVTGTVTAAQATAANLNATVVQSTAANLKTTAVMTDSGGTALTSATRGTERALSVQIVDSGGAQITSFGSGSQATAGSAIITTGPQIMGSDGTFARQIQTTTGGVLKVDGSATTQPVSGTVTVSQATAANLNATVTGTVTAAQATAANLNATVVQGTAANLNATVVQGTAANFNAQTVGNIAHGTTDSGNPLKIGAKTIDHGTAPTAVTAGARTDIYSNRHGVLFTMGGHPNLQLFKANYTTIQTNVSMVTVAAGFRAVITRASVTASNANTVNVSVSLGINATAPGSTDTFLSHPGLAPGSGVIEGNGSGMIAIGAVGTPIKINASVPTGGSIDVVVAYYLIESA